MNSNHKPDNDEQLNEVLRQWTIEPSLPPRFQEQVWRRIALAEAKPRPWTVFWGALWRFVEANVPRPKVAYAYVVILLLLGVVGGAWAAQRETSRVDTALGSRYVQSVDPYQKVAFNQ